jgi:hypothetical protein
LPHRREAGNKRQGTKTADGTWTHIPPEKVMALAANTTCWHNAFKKTPGLHTSVDTKVKNGAREAAKGWKL